MKYGHWANFDLDAIDPNLGIPGAIVTLQTEATAKSSRTGRISGPHVGFAYSPSRRWSCTGSYRIRSHPPVLYYQGVPYGFLIREHGRSERALQWDRVTRVSLFQAPRFRHPTTMFPIVNVDPRSLLVTQKTLTRCQYGLTKNARVEISYVGTRTSSQDSALRRSAQRFQVFLIGEFPEFLQPGLRSASAAASGFLTRTAASVSRMRGHCAVPANCGGGNTCWLYPSLFIGLPLGQSFLTRSWNSPSGPGGLTLELTILAAVGEHRHQQRNYDVAGIQDFANWRAAHTLSPYDQKHVVKGYWLSTPFGNEHRLGFEGSRFFRACSVAGH